VTLIRTIPDTRTPRSIRVASLNGETRVWINGLLRPPVSLPAIAVEKPCHFDAVTP
jgi:hypothetical protein